MTPNCARRYAKVSKRAAARERTQRARSRDRRGARSRRRGGDLHEVLRPARLRVAASTRSSALRTLRGGCPTRIWSCSRRSRRAASPTSLRARLDARRRGAARARVRHGGRDRLRARAARARPRRFRSACRVSCTRRRQAASAAGRTSTCRPRRRAVCSCSRSTTWSTRPTRRRQDDVTTPAAIAGIDHVVVRTEAPEAAIRFYGDSLGLRLALDKTFEQWGARLLFFRVGGVTVEIAAPAKPVATPACARFVLGHLVAHARRGRGARATRRSGLRRLRAAYGAAPRNAGLHGARRDPRRRDAAARSRAGARDLKSIGAVRWILVALLAGAAAPAIAQSTSPAPSAAKLAIIPGSPDGDPTLVPSAFRASRELGAGLLYWYMSYADLARNQGASLLMQALAEGGATAINFSIVRTTVQGDYPEPWNSFDQRGFAAAFAEAAAALRGSQRARLRLHRQRSEHLSREASEAGRRLRGAGAAHRRRRAPRRAEDARRCRDLVPRRREEGSSGRWCGSLAAHADLIGYTVYGYEEPGFRFRDPADGPWLARAAARGRARQALRGRRDRLEQRARARIERGRAGGVRAPLPSTSRRDARPSSSPGSCSRMAGTAHARRRVSSARSRPPRRRLASKPSRSSSATSACAATTAHRSRPGTSSKRASAE